jgi:alpha-1,3-rhamnosyl/mannosyltransferase
MPHHRAERVYTPGLIAQLGAPPDKVTVIHEAANPMFKPLLLPEARRAVCAQYHLPERFILCVGTIEPRKNINGLLHAFAHL